MPDESREICFTTEEFISALIDYSRRTGREIWHGKIRKVTLTEGANPSATLHLRDLKPVACDASQIAAILIFYCIQRRIPIPRSATKSVRIEGNNVVLILRQSSQPTVVHVSEKAGKANTKKKAAGHA